MHGRTRIRFWTALNINKKRFEKKFIRLKKKILLYRQKCGEIISKKTKFLSENMDFHQIERYFNNVNLWKEPKIFNFWVSKWKSIEIFSRKKPFSFFSQKKFSFEDNQFLFYYYYLVSFKNNVRICSFITNILHQKQVF